MSCISSEQASTVKTAGSAFVLESDDESQASWHEDDAVCRFIADYLDEVEDDDNVSSDVQVADIKSDR